MQDVQQEAQKLKRLSRRELEIFQQRCQGKSIADIADTLVIVESTVKYHLGNIYAKLEVDHLPQVARNLEIPKFCEALQHLPAADILPAEPDLELKIPEPISLVPLLEDELALVKPEQSAIQLWRLDPPPPGSDRPFTPDRQREIRNFLIVILSTAIISALAGAGIMALIFTTPPLAAPLWPSPPPTPALSSLPTPTLAAMIKPTLIPSSPTPKNDNFANASVINSFPYADSLDLTRATLERGEPLLCSLEEGGDQFIDNHTVWYRFTPTMTVGLFANMRSEFEASIIVYSGSSLDSLTRLGCVTSGGGEWSHVALPSPFIKNTPYYLQLGGIISTTVDIQLELP